jgi:hypothetical protein
MHADRVRAMETAPAEATKRAAVARVKEIGHRLAELSKQAAEATTRYRATADGAWQDARAAEAELLHTGTTRLRRRSGRCPRLAPPAPDLSRLCLPCPIDARGAALARRQHVAARWLLAQRLRQGAKLAGR